MKTTQPSTEKQSLHSLQEEKQDHQGGLQSSMSSSFAGASIHPSNSHGFASIESPNAKNANAIQQMANESPVVQKAAQLKSIIQKKGQEGTSSNDSSTTSSSKSNYTGLPNALKTGVENLSGISMDDVKVHYNSHKPKEMNAHAYAQGNQIHLGSGQEKHLPHETWHVVQQKQGRVKPTIQLKSGTYVNDNDGLENEATTMGERALKNNTSSQNETLNQHLTSNSNSPVQRVIVRVGYNEEEKNSWNPFVKSKHLAIAAKAEKLLEGKAEEEKDKIYDYKKEDGTLTQAKAGLIGDTLHVIGHGQPGLIDGMPANTIASNIKTNLGADAKSITSVKLHSCYSNIQDEKGNTSGQEFQNEFEDAKVEAASGIHFANEATNLPPRYTGFMYAQKAAKNAMKNHYRKIGMPLDDDSKDNKGNFENEIKELFTLFNNSYSPIYKFLKENIAILYQGLDPVGEKTEHNQQNFDEKMQLGINMDAMPNTNYPETISSLEVGIYSTYDTTRNDIVIMLKQNLTLEKYQLRNKLEKAYIESLANYKTLRSKLPADLK